MALLFIPGGASTASGDYLRVSLGATSAVLGGLSLGSELKAFSNVAEAGTDVNNAVTKAEDAFIGCFVAGTLVLTDDGYEKIIDIQTGDLVLSRDEVTGVEEYKLVTETYVRKADRLIKITLENGELLEATKEHPFWVVGIGWVAAENLSPDHALVLAGDLRVKVVDVVEVE